MYCTLCGLFGMVFACRVLARRGISPPLGAAPSPTRLLSFFGKFCTPHPDTWGALLQGLVISGDRGTRTFKTLRAAMTQPYNYLAMSGYSHEALDKARSRVLAMLLRGVLAAPEQGSRLVSVSAAAAAMLQQDALAFSSSSSSTAELGFTAEQGIVAVLDVAAGAVKKAAVLNATVLSDIPSSSSSGNAGGWFQAVQQAAPGLLLQQQPVHTRLQVLMVLQIFQVLKSWGVVIHHDAALAAALQVLRFCWDTEDARQSGGCA